MDYAKKYKWALTGFIIMVVLNIAVLLTIWVVKPDGRHLRRNDPVQFRMQRFIERELNFTDTQTQAFEKLRRDHFRETRSIYGNIRNYRRSLFSELQGMEPSQARIDSLTEEIGQAQKQLDFAIYKHFREVREICNEEQKQKLDTIIRKVMQRMNPEDRIQKRRNN